MVKEWCSDVDVEKSITLSEHHQIMKREVKLYTTTDVDIRHEPTGEEHDAWADDIYDARGQIGLLVEEATILSGIDWDPTCEGTVMA